ncbi:HI0074 family nucleotidyltransferase substrate-binding subunit [bacterium]|nr:HI0074 family nucleotidyltransferase substrate-binding subunit [bacterium]
MEKLKREQILSALDRLEEALIDLENKTNLAKKYDYSEQERLYRSLRDSLILRFELVSDLFWKYLKRYLSEQEGLQVDVNTPKSVIRFALKAKLLSEIDSEVFIKMIEDRNMSSHIYKEEIADEIALKIAGHYECIKKYIDRLCPQEI